MSGGRAQALKDGRETYWARCAEQRTSRFEEFDFLTDLGIRADHAAIQAGWPTLTAAAKALYRARHPLAGTVDRARAADLRSATRPLTSKDTSP